MSLPKHLLQFTLDTALIVSAYTLAFLFRFDFQIPQPYREAFLQGLCIVVFVKPVLFLSMGFYRKLWHYASVRDAVTIFKVVTIASACSWSVLAFFRFEDIFPRSIIFLDWLILLFLAASSRLAWRLHREHNRNSGSTAGRRTLIVGAGDAGRLLLTEIDRQSVPDFNVIGFIDDDDKQNMLLGTVPVLGTQQQLQELVQRHAIEELILAVPSVRGHGLRKLIENCNKTGAHVSTLPAISEIINCKVSVSELRDVELEDLLGREPVILNKSGIHNYLQGKTVLVSGAAGSIGSEICRQIAAFAPGKLILLDNSETPLFYVDRELVAKHPGLHVIPVLGDVRSSDKIDNVFAEFTPDVVFHAAAYKHVSMIECNPTEAVSNNIKGTMILADAAHRAGVASFVMISSDKAVNPTNIMGASKRVAEIYIQTLAKTSMTRFSTVRFGNVLGSNGSVIPIFKEQIKKGGPVTVTDPNVVRYFMTIPEAAQLVLQAGCIGRGGEIFLLDMGEPIRILDLAEELIRLSGLTPRKDIDIVFTGLRPGEKLFEELLTKGEGITETCHEKIRIAGPDEIDPDTVAADLDRLFLLAERHDIHGMVLALRQLVLEFTPSCHYRCPVGQDGQPAASTPVVRRKKAARSSKILPLRQPVAKNDFAVDGI